MANNPNIPDNEKPKLLDLKPAKPVKRGIFGSALQSFVVDEGKKIWENVVKPGAKGVALEFFRAWLYRDSSNYQSGPMPGARVDYRGTSNRSINNRTITISGSAYPPQPAPAPYSSGYSDYNSMSWETFSDAQNALFVMQDIIKREGVIRISRFYEDVCRVRGYGEYTDEYYGWTSTAGVVPTYSDIRKRWYLTLPRPMPIDRM